MLRTALSLGALLGSRSSVGCPGRGHGAGAPVKPSRQPDYIVSTSDGILLLVNNANHVAETGRLDASGNYLRLRTHTGFDVWTHIVPTSNGLVLFYFGKHIDSGTGKVVTGRVGDDGSYVDLKSYTGFDPWSHIVSTSDGILLFYNSSTGVAVTGRIDADGNYADLRTATFDLGWRLIVPTTNGLVLFYRGHPGDVSKVEAVVGRIDAQGAYTDVSLVRGLDGWSRIVSVR